MSHAPDIQAKLEENRAVWDAWTRIHESAAFYDVSAFRAGESTLCRMERDSLGDVTGKSLLHLQCHFGLDTLSWAGEGAVATGVDFSEESISLARSLAAETGMDARFIQSDLYELPQVLRERFDIVYTSRGALCWLPDIWGWAHVVAHMLEPGGRFYIFESHPTAMLFDEELDVPDLRVRYPYFDDPDGIIVPVVGSYADRSAIVAQERTHQWMHTLGDIVTALTDAGLAIDVLREHEFGFWPSFPNMSRDHDDPQIWHLDDGAGLVPLTFSLQATRL